MRYVEISVPEGRRQAVLNVLEDERIDYTVADETGGRKFTAIVRFPLPTRAVEPTLDKLSRAGIGDEAQVVVLNAETVISRDFDDLRERRTGGGVRGERTSRQVLQRRADELTPAFSIYLVMLLISAVVATAGLLADSPAVVVGSMVIAPLIGPALAANVGIVTGDARLKARGFRYQAIGLVVVVAASVGLATLARVAGLEPAGVDIVVVAELQERVSPNLFSIAVALGAGVAGILSLTRGFSEAIVGVMIAAALIPPAAAVGITAAWGMYGAAVGAALLLSVNVFSINFAALVTLWVAGYRPQGLFDVSPTRRSTYTFAAVFGVALLVLTAPLVSVTLLEFHETQLKSAADEEVDSLLQTDRYDEFEAESVEVVLGDDYPLRSVEAVAVTVSGADTGEQSALSDELYEAITTRVDEDVVVEVQTVVADRRGGDSASDARDSPSTQDCHRVLRAESAGNPV